MSCSTAVRVVTIAAALVYALPCMSSAAGQSPPADWASLDARAGALYAAGDLPKAIEAAAAALKIAASPRESGRSLDRLGFLYYTSGNLTEGEKDLRQSLRVRQDAFGVDSLEYAETANDLAMLLRDLRHMGDARALADRSVATRERRLDANDPLLAESLNTLGTIEGLSGDYATAVSTFERAMAIHERRPAAERATEEYGTLCTNLAGTYQRLGKYALADTTFGKGLDALRVKPGAGHPAYAVSLLAYAALKVEIGRYTDAERLYDEGGRLLVSELGEAHPLYATFLNNRGFLFQSIGNVGAAAADYQASLDLKRKLYGPASTQALSTLRNLAHLTYPRDHAAGMRMFAEAVNAYSSAANAPAFDFTSVLLGLGRAERERGDLPDARSAIQKALAVSRDGLGTHHPLYATALRELGLVDAASGDAVNARQELDESLRVAQEAHGPDHPDIASFLDALAGFDVQQGDVSAALALYRRSLDISDRALADALAIGSESFKAASVANSADLVPTLIELQATAGARAEDARALAFEAVTRRKGRVLEHVRDWRQGLRASSDPVLRAQSAEWQALLECRTSLTVALGYRELKPSVIGGCGLEGTALEGRYERLLSDVRTRRTDAIAEQAVAAIDVLTRRGDALEAALNRALGDVVPHTQGVTVDAIRAGLAPDEVLVEFVAFDDRSIAADGRRKYGAFVLDSGGQVSWRDLGETAPIDAAVGDLLAAANDWSTSARNHETLSARASMRTASAALADLSRRIWTPLRPLIDAMPGVHRLRIAPDALLNLVPFEALSDTAALIDRFAITYVPAGRDLIPGQPSPHPGSAPVIIVSPGTDRQQDNGALERNPAFRAGRLSTLTQAAGEANDVRHALSGAQLYSVADATERRVKGLHGPELLHIVGHGVIRGDDAGNIMSGSGIVLEEAYGRGGRSPEDGLLTPLELENVDLLGTEMLVLSQCQMAGGVASVGEGVYGMRRAAVIAGARTFVAPLWNVEDRVQRTLMSHFYARLAAGQSRADALREAKLDIRRSPSTRSFLYWAPVILSGAAGRLPASLFH